MPFTFIADVAEADITFEATGTTKAELFIAASDAVMSVMVKNIETIVPKVCRPVRIEAATLEMLLFSLLQAALYYKDSEQLLLRMAKVKIIRRGEHFRLAATACGENIDPARHPLNAEAKAVTLHPFAIEKGPEGWKTRATLDI